MPIDIFAVFQKWQRQHPRANPDMDEDVPGHSQQLDQFIEDCVAAGLDQATTDIWSWQQIFDQLGISHGDGWDQVNGYLSKVP